MEQDIFRMPVKFDATGTTVNNASAILEVNATDKGVLIPNMTNAQMLAIISPATSLLVYQTDTVTNYPTGTYQYNGTAWVRFDDATPYTAPNYYRVDLNSGDDLTGVPGREDKPYRLIQTVWDLIATSSTAQITIEIVGDFTFYTHAILTSVNKDNITFLFKGKIVYAVPATPGSRPLFTFSGTNNNLTFIVPNYTQTTQGGFIYVPGGVTNGNRYIFDNMQILMGVSTSTVNNFGFTTSTTTNQAYFTCNNLTVSMTGDGSGIKGYAYPFGITSCNYKIGTLKITGTASVASTEFRGFTGTVKNIYIDNLITDNSYTNLTVFSVTSSLVADNVFVNNISVASDGATQKSISFGLFSLTAKNLTIMSGSILNFGVLTTSTSNLDNLNLGELTLNGVITSTSGVFTKNINLLGNITKTVASQSADKFLIWIGAGAIINGNGFKVFHTDPTYIASTAIIMITGSASPKTTFINNLTIYNSNMITNNANPAFIPIYYNGTETKIVRFRNLVVSSSNDAHTHANTTFIRPYNANTLSTCRIEGNVATNYLQNVTNLTNDTDIDIINGYTL